MGALGLHVIRLCPRVLGFSYKNMQVFVLFDWLLVLPFSELGFREFKVKFVVFRVSGSTRVFSFRNNNAPMNGCFVQRKVEMWKGHKIECIY